MGLFGALHAPSLAAVSRGCPSLWQTGFVLVAAPLVERGLPGHGLSGCASQPLAHRLGTRSPGARERGLSSAGVWAQLLRGARVSWTRHQTMSPALAGRSLPAVAPGASAFSCDCVSLTDCRVLVPAYSSNVIETSECVLIFGGHRSIS